MTASNESEAVRWPSGLPYIVANEAAERFSFYGMRAILLVFITTALRSSSGALAPLDERYGRAIVHGFIWLSYAAPLLGAYIADFHWGKYKTILRLSLLYCAGHAVLAWREDRIGLFAGLILIALGAGGIKPCVSAHLGDQFQGKAKTLLDRAFSWFYLFINLGALVGYLLSPWVFSRYGSHVAFALPGLAMTAATLFFWFGRKRYRHVPPTPVKTFLKELSQDDKKSLGRVALLFLPISAFWALFDQYNTSWIQQALRLRTEVFGIHLEAAQIQSCNPIFVLLLIPLSVRYFYPNYSLSLRNRIRLGMFSCAASFLVIAALQWALEHGYQPSLLGQVPAYFFLTVGEILVSISMLELAYRIAPDGAKSIVSAFYALSVALGNLLTMVISLLGKKELSTGYFLGFTALVLVAQILFNLISKRLEMTANSQI